jgi:hypothetical protein
MSIHSELKFLVAKEKFYTNKILEKFIYLLNSRAFAELGYSSLYEYAMKELGYSEDQAYRRIAAAKVLRVVPEASDLSLSKLVKASALLKDKNLDRAGLAARVLSLKDISACEADKLTRNKSSKKIELTAETLKLLEEVKYDLNTGDTNELIQKLCKFYKNKTKPREIKSARAIKVDKKQLTFSRYIQAQVKDEVMKKSDHQCEFVGSSGKRCEAKTKLEFAHHYPYSLGGENKASNLKIYCKTHNLYEAQILGRSLGDFRGLRS